MEEESRESEFLSHDGPLREDVSRLGTMVGRMLAEQGGTAFFERVEQVRIAAIRRRREGATVNELAAPVDMPVHFKLTSTAMMNSFFIPSLAGQVYTMPGMQTVLNAVINQPGDFDGFSSNYSGHGFTDMRFRFLGMSQQKFDQWVAKVRADGGDLDTQAFDRLNQPSRAEPVHYYARFDADLYHRILNQCVDPGQMCMDKMMHIDAGRTAATHGDAMSDDPSMVAPAHDAATH